MAKLTPFGVALRKLRIDRELRLHDVAEKLGKSAAMISAIETGRKPIPDAFLTELFRKLELTVAEHRALRSAKDQTVDGVDVSHLKADARELVAAFARRAEELPENLINELRQEIFKSLEEETPFQRRRGILVPPQSHKSIEQFTINVRNFFKLNKEIVFPIIELIEFMLPKVEERYSFHIWTKEEMGADEGYVPIGRHAIVLREDVYQAACRGEGRARFTAAHELGHYVMHHQVSMGRSSQGLPIYRDAEWQADVFAGHLLLPRSLSNGVSDEHEASRRFQVSAHAARLILKKYAAVRA